MATSMHSRQGLALVVLAGALWGTMGVAVRITGISAHPLSIGFVRIAGGFLILHVLRRVFPRSEPKTEPRLYILAAAGIGLAAFQLCFFSAVARADVGVVTLVTMGSAPVLAGIYSAVVSRRSPGVHWLLSALLAIVGCSLLISESRSEPASLVGVLLALAAGSGYTVLSLATERLRLQHPMETMRQVFGVTSLILLPFAATAGLGWLTTPLGAGAGTYLALFTGAGAFLLFAGGLQHIPAHVALVGTLMEPLTAVVLGTLVLHERFTRLGAIGAAVIGLALFMLSFSHTSPFTPASQDSPQ